MTGSHSDEVDENDCALPVISGCLVGLPSGSESVQDAEEEVGNFPHCLLSTRRSSNLTIKIFFLYTGLNNDNHDEFDKPLGLGSVDSKLSEITITIDLLPPSCLKHDPVTTTSPGKEKSPRRTRNLRGTKSEKKSLPNTENKTVEVVLEQDPSSLRSRKGDTGSVLWRASVHLARYLLSEHHFSSHSPLLDLSKLESTNILELGAGIGFLATLLPPHIGSYTVTDIKTLLPLIRKNVLRNLSAADVKDKVTVAELDWLDIHQASTHSWKQKIFPTLKEDGASPRFDLIICCDCIYNTSLVPPLISTLNHCCLNTGGVVLVVVELREVDVLREFLTTWLDSCAEWRIWRLPAEKLGPRTVGWIGWKES